MDEFGLILSISRKCANIGKTLFTLVNSRGAVGEPYVVLTITAGWQAVKTECKLHIVTNV